MKLEQINIVPNYAKINALPEWEARGKYTEMLSIASQLAFELYLNETNGVSSLGKSEFIETILEKFSKAALETGTPYTSK